MLLNQWAINTIFEKYGSSELQCAQFIHTGTLDAPAETKEPINPLAEEIVAQILANGGRLTRIEN